MPDDNYIYITGWHSNHSSDKQNTIVRISRNKLWSMFKNTTKFNKGKLTSNAYDVLTAQTKVNGQYSNYAGAITAITSYKDGKFLIKIGNYTP